ncbi:MAG: glycosyltransferase family 9 protein [Bacteriovoracaceae bacterium]|nr:glycosyltransferase family 9 protein [Bacteriovoracaceae bacterium]
MKKKFILVNVSGIGDIVSSLIVANPLLKLGTVAIVIPKNFKGLLADTDFIEFTDNQIPEEEFDVLIDLTSNTQSRSLTKKIKANFKLGRSKNFWHKIKFSQIYHKMVPKYPTSDHITWDFKPILDYLKIELSNTTYLSTTLKAEEKEVCIHIGADKEIRRIPIQLIVKCCEYFQERKIPVRIIGIEQEIVNEVLERTNAYPLYEKGSLSDVKRWLNNSIITVASDSGLFHLASSLNKKSIGLYGPNTYKRSGSVNPNAQVLELDYDCRPCNQNVACPYENKCMKDITWESLKAKIEEMMGTK